MTAVPHQRLIAGRKRIEKQISDIQEKSEKKKMEVSVKGSLILEVTSFQGTNFELLQVIQFQTQMQQQAGAASA